MSFMIFDFENFVFRRCEYGGAVVESELGQIAGILLLLDELRRNELHDI
jgi:hypothetical protein